MLDRWDYTEDETFLKEQVLPMAESVLAYFDTRFKKDANGKIVLDPTQAVETVLRRRHQRRADDGGLEQHHHPALCAARATDDGRAACVLRQDESRLSRRAGRGSEARRQEGPQACACRKVREAAEQLRESRAVRRSGRSASTAWASRGWKRPVAAYAHRLNHLDVGWGYDGNCAALLGLTDEAARILKVKCANSHPAYRWPATWGPNFDWLPDQDHGSNLLETTQLMLLQSDGDKIRLLPAWPKQLGRSVQVARPAQHDGRVRLSRRQDRAASRRAGVAAKGRRLFACTLPGSCQMTSGANSE